MGTPDDIPRVLARNNACHQCRKRKLKCDAVRPSCCHCSKPRIRGAAAHQPAEPCTWDAPRSAQEAESSAPASTSRRRSTSDDREIEQAQESAAGRKAKKSRIAELESRLAAFEGLLLPNAVGSHSAEPSQSPSNSNPNPIRQSSKSSVADQVQWTNLSQRPLNVTRPASSNIPSHIPSHGGSSWNRYLAGDDMAADIVPLTGPSEVFWSDWPRDLPSLQVVQHAVGVFFEKIPTLPKMLHRATFMSQLQLPPSHYAFPASALLHAILAITANHMPEAALSSRAYFPIGTPNDAIEHPVRDLDPEQEPARVLGFGAGWRYYVSESPVAKYQLWHRRKAFESCPVHFDKGEKLVQCVQAHVIATTVDLYNAWWVDLWMEASACLRMAVPLGLNESKDVHPDALAVMIGKVLLRPPISPREHEERVRTFWMAYMLERSVSFSTVWPASLGDDDISVELPITQTAFDMGMIDFKGCQNLHSPDFLTTHPIEHADSLSLCIKAHKLQGEINQFFRRYSKGPHTTQKYAADPSLRTLLNKISTLRMGCPVHLRRPAQIMNGSLDIDLLTATMITHAGLVSLAEPLITVDSWTHDISRMCLTAIRSILSILYDITATSFDLTLLPATCAWAWTMAARCLLRFIRAASEAGDMVSVQVFSSEVEVFRLALKRYGERYPTGQKHLKQIDNLIERNEPIGPMCDGAEEVFRAVTITTIEEGSTRTTPSFMSLHTPPTSSNTASGSGSGSSQFDQYPTATGNVDNFNSNGNHSNSASLENLNMAFAYDSSGFDISSFSFDYDAISELFAGNETTFNGTDFLFK